MMDLFHRGGRISESWTYDAKAQLMSAAAVMHLGSAHRVIIGTKNGRLICIDEAGKEQWQFATGEQLSAVDSFFVDQERVHSIDAPPVIADINLDGKQEIVFGTELGTLYCVSQEGKLLWKKECGGSIRTSVCVADMNLDGHPEIIASCGNKIVVFAADGKKIFEYITDAPVDSTPAVLKGKQPLIIFGNSKGTLTALTPGQEIAWRVELEHKITAAPAFFTDPEEERMVIGTVGGEIVCISEHGEIVWVFRTLGSVPSSVAIADINADHQPEIVAGSCDNNVYALTAAGKKLWSYQTDFWIAATPVIADIDGDGKLEIVAGSYDHNVYVLDSLGTYVLDYVPGLSGIMTQAGHYSNLLTSDPGEQTGKKLFQYQTPSIIVGCSHIPLQKPLIVVSTKAGQVMSLRHEN